MNRNHRTLTKHLPPFEAGQKFNRLTAIEFVGRDKSGRAKWSWRCECGNIHIATVHDVRSGNTMSCGCARSEAAAKRNVTYAKHRLSGTPEHRAWSNIISRCYNPNSASYINYGARGITVCDRWKSFKNFLSDVGPRPSQNHSIDRIDNDGNYELGNCRWATKKEQANNRRPRRPSIGWSSSPPS